MTYQQFYTSPHLPDADQDDIQFLCQQACDKVASLGALTRTRDAVHDYTTFKPVSAALSPAPVPKAEFEKIWQLQPELNRLYSNIVSRNPDWIISALTDTDDSMVQKLLQIWKDVRTKQVPQVARLNIFRNDYMVDPNMGIKNIEINMFSTSMMGHMEAVAETQSHVAEYMQKTTPKSSPEITIRGKSGNKPVQHSFVHGFIEAHKLYGNPDAIIIMLTDNVEWNIMDQRRIQYGVQAAGVQLKRYSYHQLVDDYKTGKCNVTDGKLYLNNEEVAIVYFRFGYEPNHYKTEDYYKLREVIEASRAIKCPSLEYNLLNFKRIQIELAKPGVLESLYTQFDGKIDSGLISTIRSTYARIWSASDEEGYNTAIANPDNFVLKENAEGGMGLLLTGSELKNKIESCVNGECGECLSRFIIMERVRPLQFETISCLQGVKFKAVSEMGIYACMLEKVGQSGESDSIQISENSGYLVRSKPIDALGGGFAVGISTLDEIYFV